MPNPKASQVVTELRKLADGLDTLGDQTVPEIFIRYWASSEEKEDFLALAKVFPRPFQKEFDTLWLRLRYETGAGVHIQANIPRSAVCRIVEPAREAVYECEPVLSAQEESTLAAQ